MVMGCCCGSGVDGTELFVTNLGRRQFMPCLAVKRGKLSSMVCVHRAVVAASIAEPLAGIQSIPSCMAQAVLLCCDMDGSGSFFVFCFAVSQGMSCLGKCICAVLTPRR